MIVVSEIGRAVVAAYGTRHTGRDGEDQHGLVCPCEYSDNDRGLDAECSTGCACGEHEETAHHKDDRRQEVEQLPLAVPMEFATNSEAPRPVVIAFNVHARIKMIMGGIIVLVPSGIQLLIDSLSMSTFRAT